MAGGIEQTKCVAVLMTQKNHDKVNDQDGNDNCKLEFSHAARMLTNNKMIAIVIEPCMTNTKKWKGLVGLHLGGKMYLNMSEDVEDEIYLKKQIKGLQKEFRSMGIHPTKITSETLIKREPFSGIFFSNFIECMQFHRVM